MNMHNYNIFISMQKWVPNTPKCIPGCCDEKKNSTSYLRRENLRKCFTTLSKRITRLLFPIIIFYESFSFSVAFSLRVGCEQYENETTTTRFKIMNFLTFFLLSFFSLFSTIKMSILLTDFTPLLLCHAMMLSYMCLK